MIKAIIPATALWCAEVFVRNARDVAESEKLLIAKIKRSLGMAGTEVSGNVALMEAGVRGLYHQARVRQARIIKKAQHDLKESKQTGLAPNTWFISLFLSEERKLGPNGSKSQGLLC